MERAKSHGAYMTSIETTHSKQTTKAASRNKAVKEEPTTKHPSATSTASKPDVTNGPYTVRVTKHDRILTLLTRREGATITR